MTPIQAIAAARALITAGTDLIALVERATAEKRDLTPNELAAVQERRDDAMRRLADAIKQE